MPEQSPETHERPAGQQASDDEVTALISGVRRANVILDASTSVAQNALKLGRTDLLALELLSTGEMTAGDIARELRISTGTVTGVIDRLEANGYAGRRGDARDRRRVHVAMTPAGRRRFREAFRPRWRWLEAAATHMSGEEVACVVRFLEQMHEFMPEEWRPEARPQEALSSDEVPGAERNS